MKKTFFIIRKVTVFILKHVIPFVSLFFEDTDPQVIHPKKPKKWQDSEDGGQDASTEKENL